MYFEVNHRRPDGSLFSRIDAEISPHDFHRNKRIYHGLIVDSPAINAAVRNEYVLCYGSINILVPNFYDDADLSAPLLFLRFYKDFDNDPYDCFRVIVTDDELFQLFCLRYPKYAKRPEIFDETLQEYHRYIGAEEHLLKQNST